MSVEAQNRSLILDLVEWVAVEEHSYDEVMERWRTSCPRLTVWEDALDQGLVARAHRNGLGAFVRATEAGKAALKREGRRV
ncbi:MAG: hypothetical protein Q8P46_12320 [Hyphomicrobiales bacterium]|nr:hypothetical protein [Hyphomicrobiales bacterium]